MDDLAQLRRGDIVFYRPRDFSLSDIFDSENFSMLAAYVQSHPYQESRPWHHAAVCVRSAGGRTGQGDEPARIVGFPQSSDGNIFGSALVTSDLATAPRRLAIDVLRPDPDISDSIASVVWDQAKNDNRDIPGAAYSFAGLFGFGLMMLQRMLPRNSVRLDDEHLDLAWGADAIARSLPAETCTSNIAKAVDLFVPLDIQEPPDATELPKNLSVQRLAERMVEQLEPTDDFAQGGPLLVETTSQYLQAIELGIDEVLRGLELSEVKKIGRRVRAGGHYPVGSQLTSPAMLHDALLRTGRFAEVA